jgi:hypothetical protein
MMCKENRDCFIILLAALLLSSALGVLHGQEADPWYLISEAELRSIERYRNEREAERRNWLSQVSALSLESGSLNGQLAQAREANRELTELFNKYEQEQLTLTSLKNGEIARLEKEQAAKTLEADKYKAQSAARLMVIIALAAAWVLYIAYRVCRFFRLIPV